MPDAPRYLSPLALGDAIASRVKSLVEREAEARTFESDKERHRFTSTRPSQLRCDIAVQRFVARLVHLSPTRWVIKGGVALHVRLDPSRPSLDLDLADTTDDMTRELQIRDLEAVARIDLDDYFQFDIDRDSAELDDHGSMTIAVIARIGNSPFEQFDIDLAPLDVTTVSEMAPLSLPIDIEISQPIVQVSILQLEPQLADKICAMHELHGERKLVSSRWRDLADVAMIAMQCTGIAAVPLLECLRNESARRTALPDGGLPRRFELPPEQIREWQQGWGGRGRTVPVELKAALEIATRFINPLLDASADGEWDPVLAAWSSTRASYSARAPQ